MLNIYFEPTINICSWSGHIIRNQSLKTLKCHDITSWRLQWLWIYIEKSFPKEDKRHVLSHRKYNVRTTFMCIILLFLKYERNESFVRQKYWQIDKYELSWWLYPTLHVKLSLFILSIKGHWLFPSYSFYLIWMKPHAIFS